MEIRIQEGVFIRTNVIKPEKHSIWFLHGFADSGLAYKEVFQSRLSEAYNIYVVDLPGFGVSPINKGCLSIKGQADLLSRIINEETSAQTQVTVVAHSLGALIGTWICQNLINKINIYFNIEGNLTEADSYFSSKPLQFNTAEEFVDAFQAEIFARAMSEERYRRYYCSVKFANPEGMRNWSLTSQEYVKNNRCGIEFMELACRKIYIWGDKDTPDETQRFIEENNIPNRLYQGVGHWHMVENSNQLYEDINNEIKLAYE